MVAQTQAGVARMQNGAGGIREFGRMADGAKVQAITLRAGALSVTLLTLGAILQEVRLAGVAHGLTLGSDRVADYEGAMRYHGSLIGPVVNRLSGAEARIGDVLHRFEANQDGCITLHGGAAGTHLKLWQIARATDTEALLTLTLPAGEGGFPGRRQVQALWQIAAPASLTLTISASTDADTLINFANHSYWNLDGSSTWAGHSLRVAADRYLPTTEAFTPTGAIADVAGTAMDFREGRAIAPGDPLLDTCFCLSDSAQPLRDVLWLTGQSGVGLTVATTEPGIQVYDGRNALRPGQTPHEGLAIEAQLWPDAPAHPEFPSILLRAGESRAQTVQWRFEAPQAARP